MEQPPGQDFRPGRPRITAAQGVPVDLRDRLPQHVASGRRREGAQTWLRRAADCCLHRVARFGTMRAKRKRHHERILQVLWTGVPGRKKPPGEHLHQGASPGRQACAIRGRQGRAVLLRPLRTAVHKPAHPALEHVPAQPERPQPRGIRWRHLRRFHLQVLRADIQGHSHDGAESLHEEPNSRQQASRNCRWQVFPLRR